MKTSHLKYKLKLLIEMLLALFILSAIPQDLNVQF